MQQHQNKPVLTMKMILFLCTSVMMMSPVVEGVHALRVAATSSEATTAKTMMMRRRSVQEEEVLNFNDINNNDADAAADGNHEGYDHTTVIDLYDDSDYESTATPIVDPPPTVETPILNYNNLTNNNDAAAADESSEVVMSYNDLSDTDAAAAVDTATVDGDDNDLNNNDAAASAVAADESSEVVMNYNDLTDADADADAAAAAAVDPTPIDVVAEPIMNDNGLNNNDAATAAADDEDDTTYVDVDTANGVVVVRNDNVALEPTLYVSSFDIGICMDHPNLQYITAERTSESCHWVSENVPARCPLHHTSEAADHLYLYELCPVACQQCEYLVPTLTPDGHLLLCADYPYLQFTTQDGYRRECHWVTQYPALRCQLPYTQQETATTAAAASTTDTYLDWLNRKILQDYCPMSCGLCPADYDYEAEESVENAVSPSSESSDSFVATTIDPDTDTDPDADPVAVRDTILYGALLEAQQESQSSQAQNAASASSASSSTTDFNEYIYFSDLYENYESPTTTTTTPPGTTTDDGTTTTQFTDVYDDGTASSNDDTHDDQDHDQDQEENAEVILFTDVYEFSHSADEVCHCDGKRPHCPNPEDEATFVCDNEENEDKEDESSAIQFTDMYEDDNDLESSHDENHEDHEHSEENENENESTNSSNSNSNKKKTKISPWVGLAVFLIVVLLIIVILVCDFKVRKRRRQEATDEQDSGGGMKKKKNKKYLSFDSNIDNNDTSESDENEIDEQENEHDENENNDMQRMKKIVLVDVDDGKTIDSRNQKSCYYPSHDKDIEIGDEFSVYKVTSEDHQDQTQTRTVHYPPRSSNKNSERERGPPRRNSSTVPVPPLVVEDQFEASSIAPPPHQRGQRSSTVRVIETKNTNTSSASTTTKTMREKYEAWADGNLQRHQDKLNNRMRREDP